MWIFELIGEIFRGVLGMALLIVLLIPMVVTCMIFAAIDKDNARVYKVIYLFKKIIFTVGGVQENKEE